MFCTCLACLTQSKNFAPQAWLFPWMFGRSDNYHHHKNLTCFTDMECLTQCGKSYVFYFYGRSNTNKVKTFMECLIKNQNLMCFTSLPNTRWRSDVICMYGIPDKSGNPSFFFHIKGVTSKMIIRLFHRLPTSCRRPPITSGIATIH